MSKLWSRGNLLGLMVFAAFLLLSLTKLGSFTQDESEYHFPTLLNFYQNGWAAIFNDQYAAANTPLPYLLIWPIAKLLGPSLLIARLLTAIVSFASFLLARALLAQRGASPFAVAALVFFPYFFVNSFVFYAVNFGVFFFLAGLLALQRCGESKAGNLLAGMLLSAAVMCQQFYLVVPFAVVLHRALELARTVSQRRDTALATDVACAALILAPLAVPFALFAAWGGITHVNFRIHSVMFSPTNVTGILFVVGFYFFPFLLNARRQIAWWQWLAAIAASTCMVTWLRPIYSDIQGPGRFTGLVLHLVDAMHKLQPLAAWVFLTALVSAGMLIAWLLCRGARDAWERFLLSIALVLTVPYWMNSQMGERHLLGLMVVLFLMILPRFDERTARWHSTFIGVIGIAYFSYWIFFKFS